MKDQADTTSTGEALRLDKWLWQARFFKSRSLATKYCAGGGFRINQLLVAKSHATVRPGDVLTFALGRHVRVIRVVALGTRRGPASEARTLYEDLSPPAPASALPVTVGPRRDPGTGRPTKRDRRRIERVRGRERP